MSSNETLAPGKWEAGLTHRMIAQVRNVGAAQWVGAGQIAYLQDHNERADIYLTDAAGGLPLLVTADRQPTSAFTGGFGSGFAVSPDGGTIVYTSPDDGKLYAVPVSGGKARRLTEGEGHGWRMVDTVRDYLAKQDGRVPAEVCDRAVGGKLEGAIERRVGPVCGAAHHHTCELTLAIGR